MAITEIEKRDGTIVSFDRDKIVNAIRKAMQSINQDDEKGASTVTTSVVRELNKLDGVVGVDHAAGLFHCAAREEGRGRKAGEYYGFLFSKRQCITGSRCF